MDIVFLDQGRDDPVIDQLFPVGARRSSTQFLAAVEENEIKGVLSLGYEGDTILLQYLFVPEPYRRQGVATMLLDELSDRLAYQTDSFLEAYFDEEDDFVGLKGLFGRRLDYLLAEGENYAVALWGGISPEVFFV